MTKLNLINPNESDIKYEVITFNDGQPHIKFQPLDRKALSTDDIAIVCRLATQDQLFILEQAVSVLHRHGLRIHTLIITYLQGMRMDRVMNFEEPFSLELIAARINALSAERVCIMEPHSSVTMKLINHSESISLLKPDTFKNYFIVAPDAGARQRLGEEYKKANPGSAIVGMILRKDLSPIAFCNKHRDPSTGYIDRLDIDESCVEKLKSNSKPIFVVDDLCDGGRTFVLCAEAIRRVLPDAEIAIMVAHMVNPKGIEVLSQNYQRVVITNSFRDWQNEQLPDNVTCGPVLFE